jgi:hypothetical protein
LWHNYWNLLQYVRHPRFKSFSNHLLPGWFSSKGKRKRWLFSINLSLGEWLANPSCHHGQSTIWLLHEVGPSSFKQTMLLAQAALENLSQPTMGEWVYCESAWRNNRPISMVLLFFSMQIWLHISRSRFKNTVSYLLGSF